MKIKRLTLYTNTLEAEKIFYTDTLGFKTIESSDQQFTVKVGWTELTFRLSDRKHTYHYCFLIPANQLKEALVWVASRTDIVSIEGHRTIQNFETWNADAFYFYDASGNIAECIVRYDLMNESVEAFDLDQMLCINEIGLPTNDIVKTNAQLKQEIGSDYWKGNTHRFGTNGDQEGLLLLANYDVKKEWFPTETKIIPEPFNVVIEHNNKMTELLVNEGSLHFSRVH
ncbi:MAG: catechol 2,3-dioxygenase-like lactoylglutathione lyase family enzyme [Bacteroidia bacterium]|jgi:catechol 2,3-dioxygenase-like lactoylglutathione lyase family enzyme